MHAAPFESMIDLLGRLVQVPTRGGMDPLEPAVVLLEEWLGRRDLQPERLYAGDALVGITGQVRGDPGYESLVLDAPLDTAPFGDPDAWHSPPTSGSVVDGWLTGRGAADSKAGIAVFCHVADWLNRQDGSPHGELRLLFDGDEHTGGFGGARAFFSGDTDASPPRYIGVMLGYPGDDRIVVGGRGFFRATLRVSGQSGHSGGSRAVTNAASKAARLVAALDTAQLPPATAEFGIPPKLTVTRLTGGEGFSVVPDRCEVDVDVRLTPDFGATDAQRLLLGVAAAVDAEGGENDDRPTSLDAHTSWPPYQLPPTSPVASALAAAATEVMGRSIPRSVAGPSNIGNYLASLGVEATAGFGVAYRNLHASNEAVYLPSIEPTYEVYRRAVVKLLTDPH